MTLHIFNPEHDTALASGLANFTAPHAGRQLHGDLAFLPALWASDGDAVLADDPSRARRRSGRRPVAAVAYVDRSQLRRLPIERIDPWGWDASLVAFLQRQGVDPALLPTPAMVDNIRSLSHRRTAMKLLDKLVELPGTVGQAFECDRREQVEQLLERHGRLVLKAPWSSSGRGLRFLDKERVQLDADGLPLGDTPLGRWFRNIVAAQASVMVEPCYAKVKDFGMEFLADGNGGVNYQGLSLFHTKNGAYYGNILATEAAKLQLLSRYVDQSAIQQLAQAVCTFAAQLLPRYQGPFGVDMMVVAGDQAIPAPATELRGRRFLIHPCVEVNLRRTMGHVALSVEQRVNSSADPDLLHVMRIDYTDHNYRLRINRL